MEKNSKISCVIPTLNRCPNGQDVQYNPIWWAADSLFRQENLGEIVFVDDGSNDSFYETVNKIKRASPSNVDIKWIRNEKRKGSGESRNKGVGLTTNDYIFFMDDDCITIGDDVLTKLQKAFILLKQEGESVGAISLPVTRSSLKPDTYPISQIGRLDRETGMMHGVYTRFPREYLEDLEHSFIDKRGGILRPLEIEFTGGVFLCDKTVYTAAGGFPTTKWRGACAEEAELMLNMRKKGYKTFYLPSLDEEFSVFHFEYGNPSSERFEGQSYPFSVSGISLEEILSASLTESQQSHGNRVSQEVKEFSTVLSRIRLLSKFYGNEVMSNYLQTMYAEVKDDNQRLKIFKGGVQEGLNIIEEEKLIIPEISNRIRGRYLN